jgi:predicted ABC-type ATPase
LSRRRNPPALARLLKEAVAGSTKPVAFVLAGHNGSGKSTLWAERLAPRLQIPLVNADRLTLSILPEAERDSQALPAWAQALRDHDERWQRLAQEGVRTFTQLIMEQRLPFAFETVFSHWERRADGQHYSSKIQEIKNLQSAGYFVVLLFVGLVSPELSYFRVQTRLKVGGHGVPRNKIFSRFPRTQAAVGAASKFADMTIMFDNSREIGQAFTLARVQRRRGVLFDCRDTNYHVNRELRAIAGIWLGKVAGQWVVPGLKPQETPPAPVSLRGAGGPKGTPAARLPRKERARR